RTRSTVPRELKGIVRSPRCVEFLEEYILQDPFEVDRGDALADPLVSHLAGRARPNFEVVREHETLGYAGTERRLNPLLEVTQARRYLRRSGAHHAAQTLPHHVFREISDVVLKGVWNESPAHPDPRFALVMQPIRGLNRQLHGTVEVVVV